MLWSVGSSPEVLKHCIFSHLLANFKRTNTQTKKIFVFCSSLSSYRLKTWPILCQVSEVRNSLPLKDCLQSHAKSGGVTEEDWVSCVTARVGKRWPWRFTAGMEQSQRERGWELHQAVALPQGLMSSVLHDWTWLSLLVHAVISHCNLTTCFPAVTRNTALWKGARNSNLNSFYEFISKGQIPMEWYIAIFWNLSPMGWDLSKSRHYTGILQILAPAIYLALEIN